MKKVLLTIVIAIMLAAGCTDQNGKTIESPVTTDTTTTSSTTITTIKTIVYTDTSTILNNDGSVSIITTIIYSDGTTTKTEKKTLFEEVPLKDLLSDRDYFLEEDGKISDDKTRNYINEIGFDFAGQADALKAKINATPGLDADFKAVCMSRQDKVAEAFREVNDFRNGGSSSFNPYDEYRSQISKLLPGGTLGAEGALFINRMAKYRDACVIIGRKYFKNRVSVDEQAKDDARQDFLNGLGIVNISADSVEAAADALKKALISTAPNGYGPIVTDFLLQVKNVAGFQAQLLDFEKGFKTSLLNNIPRRTPPALNVNKLKESAGYFATHRVKVVGISSQFTRHSLHL